MKTLDDLTSARPVVCEPLLEAKIQKQCVDWARKRGYWARKFSSMSQRSVPDYLFRGRGVVFATEFKREGCPVNATTGCMSTPAQVEEQEAMRAAGWIVFECDNFRAFAARVAQIEAGK